MAKGQSSQNREKRKPKKTIAAPKGGVGSSVSSTFAGTSKSAGKAKK